MRLAHLSLLLAALLLPACEQDANAAGAKPNAVATQLLDLLKGIDSKEAATEAKDQLSSLTDKLSGVLGSLKSAAGEAGKEAGEAAGGLGDMAKDIAGKAADMLSPELKQTFSGLSEQITRLMDMEGVKSAIGPTLEKLKGLIPA